MLFVWFAKTRATSNARAEETYRMARIAGVDIPREKRTEIALTYIFGIGRSTAQQICDATGVDRGARVFDLTEEEVAKLRTYIDADVKV